MDVENNAPTAVDQRLRALEVSRLRLLEVVFTLRSGCAEVFADPRRSEEERDDAAWDLAHAVGEIRTCDDELHALRELARDQEQQPVGRLVGSGRFR